MMRNVLLTSSAWSRALNLAERAAASGHAGHVQAHAPDSSKHYTRWREQKPFGEEEWFARRLAAARLDDTAFRNLLAIPPADLAARIGQPSWLRDFERAFRAGAPPVPTAPTDTAGADAAGGFLEVLRPLVGDLRARMATTLAPLADRRPFAGGDVAGGLASIVEDRLLRIIERTLVLELNVARLEERLAGKTAEERFADFVRQLGETDTADAFFAEYPVLARQVVERIDDAVVTGAEFARRLVGDWPDICARLFDGRDPGRVVDIEGFAGDPHRGGRGVAIVVLESGDRLVYKPRSLAVDVHFQELLAWINERMEDPHFADGSAGAARFATVSVLDRGDYGWMEFVAPAPCATREDARRFYQRTGGLLAVLHALCAVDCHFENLVAHGDQPVLVDLESLFHPRIPRPEPARHDQRLAVHVLGRSVLRVGLLPVPLGGTDALDNVDLSGVASVEGVLSPDRVLQWDKLGTDEMQAVRRQVTLPGGSNRPTLDGGALDVADFGDEVAEGFAAVYRLLVRHRDELLAEGGAVDAFRRDEVRAVLRPTRAYGMILHESFHPDLLRDALDRDRFLDRLWVGLDQHPALATVVPAEQRDLWRGDIPYFTGCPESRDLWTSDGERVPDFFEQPALDDVRERLQGMDEEDLVRQRWLVMLSIASRVAARTDQGPTGGVAYDAPAAREGRGDGVREHLVTQALRMGHRLRDLAEWDGDDVTWVALEYRNQRWLLEPCSLDLYVGLPGIVLFLSYLGDVTGDAEVTGLAKIASRTLVRIAATFDSPNIGLLQGWGGVLYAAVHLASLWDDRELERACDGFVARIAEFADRDEDTDLVGGLAGAIGALCAMHAAMGSERALATAVACGELLLARAVETDAGLSWRTRIGGDAPESGFSHGNAGIAWALVELAHASGDARFRRAGVAAFAFEDHLLAEHDKGTLSPEAATTGDFGLDATWCYGAPGLGLARMCAFAAPGGGATRGVRGIHLRKQVEHYVDTTIGMGFGRNHCLCHGDTGSLDFLLQAQAFLDDAALADRVADITRGVLAHVERTGGLCGTPANVASPGLLTGFAGIGYGLLRLAAPERVPSVLVFEPPRRRV